MKTELDSFTKQGRVTRLDSLKRATIEKVDSSYIGLFYSPKHSQIAAISQKEQTAPAFEEVILSSIETEEEKKARKKSHWVVYATGFIIYIGFSVVITGVYPYLKLLEGDPHLSKIRIGWVIAATPLGQMIVSPMMGYLANRLGSVRNVSYLTMVIFCIGSLMYGLLPATIGLWNDSTYHIMIFARFLIGISSGIASICRSYIASSTTVNERTQAFAMYSGAMSLGYIVGPAIQMVLNLMVTEEMMKYQAAGYVSIVLGLANIIVLTPCVFQEFNIAEKERKLLKTLNLGEKEHVLPKLDFTALLSLLASFCLFHFVWLVVETVLEPFVQDQYGWCNDFAVISVGLILSASGVLLAFAYWVAIKLSKIYDERKILLILGFGITIIGVFLMLPWGTAELQYCSNEESTSHIEFRSVSQNSYFSVDKLAEVNLYSVFDEETSSVPKNYSLYSDIFNTFCGNTSECLGCPSGQKWCLSVPQLPLIQLLVSFTLIAVSFPFASTMCNSILSKMLGPKPQGIWMGFLTASGSFARMLAPIFATYIYSELGTRFTFAIPVVFLLIGVIQTCILYKRLVPMNVMNTINNMV